MDDPLVSDDAGALVADLTVRGQTVATAESLTAGLLAAALAGVAREVLDEVGPVAAPTARALAVGARQRCQATWGVGLAGVAGPDPHGGHPVGTVFLGIAGPVQTDVVQLRLDGSRWDIRLGAVREAVARLRSTVARQ
nr:CinA family protein [Mycolicibacterium malmesburyense]CRL75532.1 CinA domain-containing protein [Mycolicibacterium malmesburyense]